MHAEDPTIQQDTIAWRLQVWVSFIVSLMMALSGVLFLPVDIWVKGYMAMGTLFLVGSTFTLAKTVRDNHEAQRLINRLSKAKTQKILKDFEMSSELGIAAK